MKKIVSMFLALVLSLAMFVIPAGAAFSVDFSGLYKEIEKAASAILENRLWYVFDGWLSSGGHVYYPGDTVSEIANVTMTAQWVRVFDLFKTIY